MRANKVNGSFTAGSGQPEVTCLAPDSLLAEPVSVLDLDLRWVQKEEVGVLYMMIILILKKKFKPDVQE